MLHTHTNARTHTHASRPLLSIQFYSHEPIFWMKLALFSVTGAASLFPTIMIIQRAVGIKRAEEGKGEPVAPLSAKLAKRMTTLVNGEV